MLARNISGGRGVILLSPGGDCVQRQAAPCDTVIAGTSDGVYILKRNDKGVWPIAHRALQGCNVSAVTASEDGMLYAATHGVGMARSDDGGKTWR